LCDGEHGQAGSQPRISPPPDVLVQSVEHRRREVEDPVIVTDHGQSAHRDVEPEGLGDVVSLVVEVRLVNNLGDPPQNRIGQLVPVQHRFERAVSGVVAELRPAHVEPSRLRSSVPNQKRTRTRPPGRGTA
jgi:hypothetical protein